MLTRKNLSLTAACVLSLSFALFLMSIEVKAGEKEGSSKGEVEGRASAEGKRAPKSKQKMSAHKAKRIFKAYDKNGDGKVTFDEWLKMKDGSMNSARKAREKKWFDAADADKDGTVSLQEFQNNLTRKPHREGPSKGKGDTGAKSEGEGKKGE